MKALTVPELMRTACEGPASGMPALRVERPTPARPAKKGDKCEPSRPVETWKTWTYAEYREDVRVAARAFMSFGLERFDAVTIYGFNAPEWHMGELAAIEAGGIAAGIYPSDTPAQVAFKAQHSGAVVAVCEGVKQATVFETYKTKGDLPKLRAVVVWSESTGADLPKDRDGLRFVWWKDLPRFAKDVSETALDKRVASIRPGHACAYIYTSGTTGSPKAVMITHDNIVFEARTAVSLLPQMGADAREQEAVLSYLPLSHVAGMMVDIVCPIVMTAFRPSSACVYFARSYDLKLATIGDRLRAVRPTMFLGVPRVWEKISEKMKAMIAKNPLTGVKLKLARWAKGLGLAHQMNCQLGGSGAKGFGYPIAKKLILDKVKQKLGLDRCKFGFTGAAPITTETLSYFGALGIQINEVYGMSECCGATTWSSDEAHVWGSCGWRMPGMEVKVFRVDERDLNKKTECPRTADLAKASEAEQGEICFRGRHIMAGYMANPDLGDDHVAYIEKKLRDAIDEDGWLHSGDKGCMDVRGMVKITGRYKELIIGAGGENIAPVPIENNVKKLCDGISNIQMIGDKRKFNVALVTLKAKGATGEFPGSDELDPAAQTISPGVTTVSGARSDKTWIAAITRAIKDTNADGDVCISNASKIQKFTILPRDFSVTTGEFTPTLKLKRSVVAKKHAEMIEKIYASRDVYVPFAGDEE